MSTPGGHRSDLGGRELSRCKTIASPFCTDQGLSRVLCVFILAREHHPILYIFDVYRAAVLLFNDRMWLESLIAGRCVFQY